MFATIQIDLTLIGRLMRENPNLVKKVQFKDGEHQLLNIAVGDRKEPDKYGNNLNVNCRPKDAPKDNKWFIGQGKLWPEQNTSPTPPAPQATVSAASAADSSTDPLPF